MSQLELFKDNSNPPKVRFIRKNGRVIPIVGNKKVNRASPLVHDRIDEMKMEVKQAEASGKSHSVLDNGNFRHFGGYSTYPGFYKQLKFRNKADFYKAAESLSGKKAEHLVEQAIDDLKGGYDTSFGRVPPNLQFRVLTKQTYDNNGVIFRKIKGKIRPIRVEKVNQSQTSFDDEVPF